MAGWGLARGYRDNLKEQSHLKEQDRSKPRPQAPCRSRVPLIQPGKRMGKTQEDGGLGGCVGTDQQASQEKRHSGCKDQRKSMVSAKPAAAWCGWNTGVRRDCLGLSIKLPRPLANQMLSFLEFASH